MPSRPVADLGALVRRPPGARPLRSEMALPGMRIGLFGGSFNPPHEGHLHVARTAMTRLGLDAVWWLVAPQNPLKSSGETAAYARRLAQVRALADEPGFVVCDLERRLGSPYTIDLVKALKRMRPRTRFVFIMGADNLLTLHRWREWQEIVRTLPIVVVARENEALRARLSPASQQFRHARVDVNDARALPGKTPPAWLYLVARFHFASSTALRGGARTPN